MAADGDGDGADGHYGTPRRSRVRDYSRDGVLAALEASLRRPGAGRIDIVLIHDPDDHAAEALDGAYPALAEYDYAPAPAAVVDRASLIAAVCARHGVPIGAVALQFVLAHPAVTAAVVGARSPGDRKSTRLNSSHPLSSDGGLWV